MTKCTVGLLEPDEGHVLFDGRNFTDMSLLERKNIRKEIGMLFPGECIIRFNDCSRKRNVSLKDVQPYVRAEMLERVKYCLRELS